MPLLSLLAQSYRIMANAKLCVARARVVFILTALMMALAMTSLARPLFHGGDKNPMTDRSALNGNRKDFTSTAYGYGSSPSGSAHFHLLKRALGHSNRNAPGGPDIPR
ncbi:hypothetical protein SLE2022_290250 [Rubroshorea leprosula]